MQGVSNPVVLLAGLFPKTLTIKGIKFTKTGQMLIGKLPGDRVAIIEFTEGSMMADRYYAVLLSIFDKNKGKIFSQMFTFNDYAQQKDSPYIWYYRNQYAWYVPFNSAQSIKNFRKDISTTLGTFI